MSNSSRVFWLTMREASSFLGVSETTLRRWTDDGMVSTFRTPGGHRRFRLHDLIFFRDEREDHPVGDTAGRNEEDD
jgi:excisionase family DNA binding protein